MIPLDKMKLQDCEMFASKWLKSNDEAHIEHFSIILSELGIGGLLTILESILDAKSRKDLIMAIRARNLFWINDIITDVIGSDYILFKSYNDSWQITNY